MMKNVMVSAVVMLLAAASQVSGFQVSPGFGTSVSRNSAGSQERANAIKLYGTKKYMKSLGEKGGMPRPNEPSYAKTAYSKRGGAKVSPPAASKSSIPQEGLSPYEEYMASRREKEGAPTAVSAPATPRVSTPQASSPRVSSPGSAGGKKSYARVKWQK